jgi:hypothetical protein
METELTGRWSVRYRTLERSLPDAGAFATGRWSVRYRTLERSLPDAGAFATGRWSVRYRTLERPPGLSLLLLSLLLSDDRHPVDRLADVRSEIKRLEAEEAKLRAYLLRVPPLRLAERSLLSFPENCARDLIGNPMHDAVTEMIAAAKLGGDLLKEGITEVERHRPGRVHHLA